MQTKNLPAEKKEWTIEYKSGGGIDIKLTPAIIRKYLIRGKAEVTTDQEILYFMKVCQARGLNPFIGDVYLIKYGADPAAIVTSIDFFRKRARAQKDCVGWESGIIVQGKDGIKFTNGLILESEKLLGGWAKATPDGWKVEQRLEVNLAGYLRYRKEKESGKKELTRFWEPENQAMMIAKVAESQLLRRLWPDEFQGLHTAEEVDSGLAEGAIDITPPPKSFEDLLREKVGEGGSFPQDLNAFIEETARVNKKTEDEVKGGASEDFDNFWKFFEIWRVNRKTEG
jgi:phage recombination protein Bet